MPDDTEVDLARRAISLLDLTDLDDASSPESVTTLCERAAAAATAAVCVWPDFVELAAGALDGTAVRVATVVNFPTGDERAFSVALQTERALGDGADEIDVVLPYRWWQAGDDVRAAGVLDAVRATAGSSVVKVILETGELGGGDQAVIEDAARFAIDHGADFVKTSTGKSRVSATPEAAETMLRVIASSERDVGLKPSGGIRTLDDAATYLALAGRVMGHAWATPETFRFGASGLLDALLAVIDGGGSDRAGTTRDDGVY